MRLAALWRHSGGTTGSRGAAYDLVSERSSDRLGFTLRPVLDRRLANALVVALAVSALITGLGYLVSYPRIAIPVLLYLAAMIWAVALGGMVPGIVAAVAGCVGLAFGELPPQKATDISGLDGSIILALFLVVAAAFATLVTRANSERWAAEAAEERLRVVLDAAPLAFILVDVQGRVQLWNAAAEQLFGWSPDEVLGELLPTVPEGGWDAFLEDLASQMAGETHHGSELRGLRKNGEEFDVAVWTEPFRDRDGTIAWAAWACSPTCPRRSGCRRRFASRRSSRRSEALGRYRARLQQRVSRVIRGAVRPRPCQAREKSIRCEATSHRSSRPSISAASVDAPSFSPSSRSQLLQPTEARRNEVIRERRGHAEAAYRRAHPSSPQTLLRIWPTVLAEPNPDRAGALQPHRERARGDATRRPPASSRHGRSP